MKKWNLELKKGEIKITETSRRAGGYYTYKTFVKKGYFAFDEDNGDWYEIVSKDIPYGFFIDKKELFKISFLFGKRKKLVEINVKPTTIKTIVKNLK